MPEVLEYGALALAVSVGWYAGQSVIQTLVGWVNIGIAALRQRNWERKNPDLVAKRDREEAAARARYLKEEPEAGPDVPDHGQYY